MSPAPVTEILDRVRRVEHKVTRLLEGMGLPTGGERPSLEGGIIRVPTPAVSLRSCLEVTDRAGEFRVVCDGELICTIWRMS